MPKSMRQFVRKFDEAERLQRRKIANHTVVATCQVGGHPIYANSVDGKDYEVLNGDPICFEHFYDTLGKHDGEFTAGRAIPHGGCVADPSD